MVPKKRQAIILTNNDHVCSRIYTSLRLIDLSARKINSMVRIYVLAIHSYKMYLP